MLNSASFTRFDRVVGLRIEKQEEVWIFLIAFVRKQDILEHIAYI